MHQLQFVFGIAFWCTFANTTNLFFVFNLRPLSMPQRYTVNPLRQYSLIPFVLHTKNAVLYEFISTVQICAVTNIPRAFRKAIEYRNTFVFYMCLADQE